MPPKTASKGSKKEPLKKKPMKPKEGGSSGGKAKKKKWSKGKVRDKLNNMVLFDKPTYDKLLKEVPQYKVITPSVVSERLKIRASLARRALDELHRRGMRINQEFAVESSRLCLVPYGLHHVPKYHQWMQSEELRMATSSEPLSIQQEYSTQQQWAELDDRLTFILLTKKRLFNRAQSGADWQHIEEEAMIGDVNLFLCPTHFVPSGTGMPGYEGEVSVMIAEVDARGCGLAAEAVAAMLKFCAGHIPVHLSSLVAKVSVDNAASLRLFQNRMGFVERSRCNIFNQVELVPPIFSSDASCHNALASRTADLILDGLRRTSADFRATDWCYTEHDLCGWRTKLTDLSLFRFEM